MELAYKPEWPAALERIEAWWDHQVLGRAAIQVQAPKQGVTRRQVPEPASLREKWTNYEYRIDDAIARMESVWYGGESLPVYMPNLGPDCFASFLGADLEFMPTTSWARPLVHDWGLDLAKVEFDPERWTWRWYLDATSAACVAGEGRFMVGLADIHAGMDALAALRHSDRLALDLVLCPEDVHRAMAKVKPVFYQVYQALHDLIQRTHEGSSTWLSAYSRGKYYPTSCDFAGLIGPHHFDEWVLPDLAEQCAWLDHPLYHLDGPTAVCHVPSLCSIPNLRAIQWVQGAGGGPMLDWIPLLQDIQSRGMGLHLSVAATEIEPLLEALDPRGVMFNTWCASQADGEALLEAAEGWTRAALKRVGG